MFREEGRRSWCLGKRGGGAGVEGGGEEGLVFREEGRRGGV